jgi:hypothetical protein
LGVSAGVPARISLARLEPPLNPRFREPELGVSAGVAATCHAPIRQFRLPEFRSKGERLPGSEAARSPAFLARCVPDAAFFPAWVVERHGVDKTAELRKLVALTAADETPEQAVALQIPLKDGTTKPFEAATADEVRQARKLIKAGEGKAVRPSNGGDEKLREAARLLEAEVESATQEWIKPNQVLARVAKGKLLIDVKGVPRDQARAIFDAISAAMED